MNDVEELKRFVLVHARGQNIPGHRELLARVEHDDGASPGSWTAEWTRTGDRLADQGKHLEACRHYAMARFPHVDGPARQEAQDRCVAAFDRWRSAGTGIESLDVDVPGGHRMRCWAAGLSAADPRPLLLIMGGIVSVKEQWGPALAQIGRLGMAGIVAEMPGIGENAAPYGPESWRQIPAVLDAVAGRADTGAAYAMTLSFSGHMALRCALADPRIRGVITTGAPVRGFFTDTAWLARVPGITIDTLAHMLGTKSGRVRDGAALRDLALTRDQLAALTIPVGYVASRRDEIIPREDPRLLAEAVRDLRLLEHDDVHGSPDHVTETRLWCLREVLRMRGVAGGPQGRLFDVLLLAQRLRRLLPL